MRSAIRTGKVDNPKVASRLTLYTLAKHLNISPKEAFELPISLVQELMMVHQEIEGYKAEKLQESLKKVK